MLVFLFDLRIAGGNVAFAIRCQEIAMSDPGGRGVRADEDIHPEVVGPQSPNLDPMQSARLTQSAHDAIAEAASCFPLSFFSGAAAGFSCCLVGIIVFRFEFEGLLRTLDVRADDTGTGMKSNEGIVYYRCPKSQVRR
jgi:hypothetical protein